jgi:UDP-glucose 4-epimerase
MPDRERILVTGASGYIARAFLSRLIARGWAGEVLGLDRVPPARPVDGVRYRTADMLSEEWARLIAEHRPDVLVHLAFVVQPMRDEAEMQRINQEGTRATFEAAVAAGARQLLYASSATAYGALADNPVPLTEQSPIRGHLTGFRYARDKAQLELFCQEFARRHPSCILSIIRPVIVLGPNVDNYISRFVYAFPVVPLVDGGRTPMQFVHEDDVAEVMVRILERQQGGAFNVAARDWITFREVCELALRPTVPVPRGLLLALMGGAWRLGWSRVESPASIVDYIHHPWVVSVDRLQTDLGYTPRHSSWEAALAMINRR